MNEATRQMILLIGVMTILIGAFVTINTAGTSSTGDPEQSNTTPVEENNTIDTGSDNPEDKADSNSTNILEQSINGWKQLWTDFKRAIEIIPGLSSNESDS